MMTIQKTYTFTTAQDAVLFSKKYSKIWFITRPTQTKDGWIVTRYITY